MKQLVLIGGGHAHLDVIFNWGKQPPAGWQLTLVSASRLSPYSGMVPGWLAGFYSLAATCIDVARLTQWAGGRFIEDELSLLCGDRQQLQLTHNGTLAYDLLSLNVGSTLQPPADLNIPVLSLRPLSALHDQWERLLQHPDWMGEPQELTVTAVGGGAAGVESLLAVLHSLRARFPQRQWRGQLLSRSDQLLSDLAPRAQLQAAQALNAAGVKVQLKCEYSAAAVAGSALLLWATGARAHAWQNQCDLSTDKDGFIQVDNYLQVKSHTTIFAAGDCAALPGGVPKSGVYAVRMGRSLSHNISALIHGTPLQAWYPQQYVLALLNTADGCAIASRGSWSARGCWVMHWKHGLDRRFIQRFNPVNKHRHVT